MMGKDFYQIVSFLIKIIHKNLHTRMDALLQKFSQGKLIV
jgi:hypothetical protein